MVRRLLQIFQMIDQLPTAKHECQHNHQFDTLSGPSQTSRRHPHVNNRTTPSPKITNDFYFEKQLLIHHIFSHLDSHQLSEPRASRRISLAVSMKMLHCDGGDNSQAKLRSLHNLAGVMLCKNTGAYKRVPLVVRRPRAKELTR